MGPPGAPTAAVADVHTTCGLRRRRLGRQRRQPRTKPGMQLAGAPSLSWLSSLFDTAGGAHPQVVPRQGGGEVAAASRRVHELGFGQRLIGVDVVQDDLRQSSAGDARAGMHVQSRSAPWQWQRRGQRGRAAPASLVF